ncbi:uncharacterized protein LOC105700329 isoform X2 [Orussus abietinus]|uniref:uncharacterized protein LOC105700329 isoform X2 n=1 Tax=Orussus abietinus TaxID=222816 RepID=UPI0006251E06|nr:uncharacterized protein LOC105700329 isoform X2 [Orussus abietinus]
MSAQCSRFVENAWKRELCSNCFKSREEHVDHVDSSRSTSGKVPPTSKTVCKKLQSILKPKTSIRGKKRVAFPECLTQIIGYGGEDFSDPEDFEMNEESSLEDEIPDSEEERALGNLTRANTNFNTVTANLTEVSSEPKRSFATLMLGKVQKDSEGKKKTLLVSVTPFGGDDRVPMVPRPSDKRTPTPRKEENFSRRSCENVLEKCEVTSKTTKGPEEKPTEEGKKKDASSGLEKIVDMPLITSNSLISVMQKTDNGSQDTDKRPCEKRTSIARSPAIKKADCEKPKISLQNAYGGRCEYSGRMTRQDSRMENGVAFDSGIQLTLTPLTKPNVIEDDEEVSRSERCKDANTITVKVENESENAGPKMADRKVDGEALKSFGLEVSRESAGEPDGKADEEDILEPPALPRSPPPIETRTCRIPLQGEATTLEAKTKPTVPQKPSTMLCKSTSPPKSSPSSNPKKTSSSYVPPPPSIQNAALQGTRGLQLPEGRSSPVCKSEEIQPDVARPSQNSSQSQSSKSHRLCEESKLDESSKVQLEASSSSTSSCTSSASSCGQSVTSGHRSSSGKTCSAPAGHKSKPPPLSLSKVSKDENEEDDEEQATISAEVTAELIRSPNKRRMAPKPPATPTEELPASMFARNPAASSKSDSPVVREKEKRERASSCSPKFRKAVSEAPDPCPEAPESNSRRNISLSQDSLANNEKMEEKKKTRSRFSLKKFLRMGSKKDVDTIGGSGRIDEIPCTPQPKPRLEIIHPLELDGAAVEVLGHERIAKTGEDVVDSKNESGQNSQTQSAGPHHATSRPGKPPPPPRNQSLDDWARLDPANKPARPPPPRNDGKHPPKGDKPLAKSWQPSASTSDSIYANLGEVRSALAPSKPQRTASMRDQTVTQPPLKKRDVRNSTQEYEAIGSAPPTSDSPTSSDSHVYECLSSSPECDSNLELRHEEGKQQRCKRKSDSSAMDSSADFKYHHQPFARSTSLPYCGSETESELYAPYSFYTGDEGAEEDQDWKGKDEESKVSRLRQRRGRSIVHRSLEDNYGAVVVANHEALAQLLEQLNQTSPITTGLRTLKTSNPRFRDFKLDPGTSVPIGRRIFYSATWNDQNVTLCIAFDPVLHVSRKEFYLVPIVEFPDSVPDDVLKNVGTLVVRKNFEATISVLPRLQVNTIQSFAAMTKDSKEEPSRESSFVLLQFVNALKNLQARGIEDAPRDLSNVVLCREDKDACYRLYLLQGLNVDVGEEREEERDSLCQCALVALEELFLTSKLPLIQELLKREKAVTLSLVKSVLEFSLWGPADATFGGPREREIMLQRWLDLERATVLHALVRTRAPLTVTDEYHLLFLVRTSAKIMCEASLLLDKQRNDSIRTN